ncbi:MAG: pyruvate kinase [Spirochaetaceae bacterium]|nr:pyruvate kinase [Spirochaetaceae bacterium]
MRKTKIICTLGPTTDEEVIRRLILNGMNVARLNFSHESHDYHLNKINIVKRLRDELQKPVAILLDTKGPEIRTGLLPKEGVSVERGDVIVLSPDEYDAQVPRIPMTYENLYQDMGKNRTILIDDGHIELELISIEGKNLRCKALNPGVIKSKKGINIPGAELRLPSMSEKDKQDVLFGIENDVDYVAASFIHNEEDVLTIRRFLDDNGGEKIMIIAKIENAQGVDNIDSILALANGVMVARGDLGVEVSFEQVPFIQKTIIHKSIALSKPAIIATQMLESMIENPRPTRAEVSDIANAIYDFASAIMLSGETASGQYPVECLQTMAKIAQATEDNISYEQNFYSHRSEHSKNITGAITNATVSTAYSLEADAIIVLSTSGKTAFSISRLRPGIPIITATPRPKVYHQLALNWGVFPIRSQMQENFDDLLDSAMKLSRDTGIVNDGDLVVIAAGVPVGLAGTTNLIRIETIGDVIVRGKGAAAGVAFGQACICRTAGEGEHKFQDNDILVIPSSNQEYLPLMKRAGGIILQSHDNHEHAQTVGLTIDIPVISDASGCLDIIKDSTMISMDGTSGLVFSGNGALKK